MVFALFVFCLSVMAEETLEKGNYGMVRREGRRWCKTDMTHPFLLKTTADVVLEHLLASGCHGQT